MTVAELIEALAKEDQSKRVVVSGYEGGECDIEQLVQMDIALNVNKETYYGPHEEVTMYAIRNNEFSDAEKVPAIKLR